MTNKGRVEIQRNANEGDAQSARPRCLLANASEHFFIDQRAQKRVAPLLSLCQKAGKLVSGEFSCERALQTGKAKLVVVAGDASGNTKKKFVNKAFYYQTPTVIFGEKEALGRAVGKQDRAVLIVTDENFALKIKAAIEAV